MRVFVVGHRGMLGHVVVRYLTEQGIEVLTCESRYTGSGDDPLLQAIGESKADWIVNAAVKTASNAANRRELFVVNAQLPVHLKSILGTAQKLVHASSDGVFSGKRGNYSIEDSPDAEDDYGLSKSLGEIIAEPRKAFVIRCSIVGPDPNNGRGLLAWLLKQTTEVHGFTNHFWNGITTLEWAKLCVDLINGNFVKSPALLQPASTAVSKFELLELMSAIYPISNKIIAEPGPDAVNRTLIPNFPRPPLDQQLREQRKWYESARAT
jgi:dTDP-4-dehydrorhamnose reductase